MQNQQKFRLGPFAIALIMAAGLAPILTVSLNILLIDAVHSQWEKIVPTLLSGLFFIILYAIMLGFIGSLLFLTPFIFLAYKLRANVWGYSIAGGLAGLAHSAVGIALYNLWGTMPWQIHDGHEDILDIFEFVTGFAMIFNTLSDAQQTLLFSAPMAGLIVGALAGQILVVGKSARGTAPPSGV